MSLDYIGPWEEEKRPTEKKFFLPFSFSPKLLCKACLSAVVTMMLIRLVVWWWWLSLYFFRSSIPPSVKLIFLFEMKEKRRRNGGWSDVLLFPFILVQAFFFTQKLSE